MLEHFGGELARLGPQPLVLNRHLPFAVRPVREVDDDVDARARRGTEEDGGAAHAVAPRAVAQSVVQRRAHDDGHVLNAVMVVDPRVAARGHDAVHRRRRRQRGDDEVEGRQARLYADFRVLRLKADLRVYRSLLGLAARAADARRRPEALQRPQRVYELPRGAREGFEGGLDDVVRVHARNLSQMDGAAEAARDASPEQRREAGPVVADPEAASARRVSVGRQFTRRPRLRLGPLNSALHQRLVQRRLEVRLGGAGL
mmetsp:Transcript_6476/g.20811  ORF Transcript_6476/g.20811 Transcript_6476/m.20811 type:complete len:258 (-) Transcript_6476:487-1260(-)